MKGAILRYLMRRILHFMGVSMCPGSENGRNRTSSETIRMKLELKSHDWTLNPRHTTKDIGRKSSNIWLNQTPVNNILQGKYISNVIKSMSNQFWAGQPVQVMVPSQWAIPHPDQDLTSPVTWNMTKRTRFVFRSESFSRGPKCDYITWTKLKSCT